MGTALTNLTPASTFHGLLKLPLNISTTQQNIEDGSGIQSALKIGSTGINIVSGFQISNVTVSGTAQHLNKLYRPNVPDSAAFPNTSLVTDSNNMIWMSGGKIDFAINSGVAGNGVVPSGIVDNAVFHNHSKMYRYLGDTTTSGHIATQSGSFFEIKLTGPSPVIGIETHTPSGFFHEFKLMVRQDGAGLRTLTWPSNILWPGGTGSGISSGVLARDIFEFYTVDGGTLWYGNNIGLNFI